MRDPSGGSSVRRLITLVACVALVLFEFVAEPEDQFTFRLGAAIVAGSIVTLAIVVFISRTPKRCGPQARMSRTGQAFLGLPSIAAATALIFASLLSFITFYELNSRLRTRRTHELLKIYPWGLAQGIIAAFVVAGRMKEFLGIQSRTTPRPRRLWPVAAVILIGLGILIFDLTDRRTFCLMMAEHHAEAMKSAADPNDVWQHAWLKQDFERRWIWPWLPLHPESVPRPPIRHYSA